MIKRVPCTFPSSLLLAVTAAAVALAACGGSIGGDGVTSSPVAELALSADDGRVSASGTSKVLVCHTGMDIPPQELECIVARLQAVIAANPGACADKVEDALAGVVTALEEFLKTPPDDEAALGNLEGVVGDLEAAFDDGNCLDPDELEALMNDLAGIARAVAVVAIEDAITQGGDPGDIGDAQDSRAEGDALRDAGQHKDAVSKYKDAVAKAPDCETEGSCAPVCPCFSGGDIEGAVLGTCGQIGNEVGECFFDESALFLACDTQGDEPGRTVGIYETSASAGTCQRSFDSVNGDLGPLGIDNDEQQACLDVLRQYCPSVP